MNDPSARNWTRRQILRTLPAFLMPIRIPGELCTLVRPAKPGPFSHFADVAASAGLNERNIYGNPAHNTYIVEVNGAGCAFFDYDNDGWMDIFILSGRRWRVFRLAPATACTTTIAMAPSPMSPRKPVCWDSGGWACGVCDWRLQQRRI